MMQMSTAAFMLPNLTVRHQHSTRSWVTRRHPRLWTSVGEREGAQHHGNFGTSPSTRCQLQRQRGLRGAQLASRCLVVA